MTWYTFFYPLPPLNYSFPFNTWRCQQMQLLAAYTGIGGRKEVNAGERGRLAAQGLGLQAPPDV